MSTTREEAVVRLGLDTTALQQKMNSFAGGFRSSLHHFGKEWGAALTVGGIVAGIERILSKFDDLQNKSDNLGVGTDFLQGIEQVARTEVVDGVTKMSRALTDLSTKLGEAKSGNAQAIASFEKFGITAADLATGDTQQVFYLIADRLKAIPDAAERSAAAFELLGKSGKNMAGLLGLGSEELKKMVDGVDKLDAQKIKDLADAKKQLEGAENSITVFFGRLIAGWADFWRSAGEVSTGLGTVEKANKEKAWKWIEAGRKKAADLAEAEFEIYKAALNDKQKAIDDFNARDVKEAEATEKKKADQAVKWADSAEENKASARKKWRAIEKQRDDARNRYGQSLNSEFLPTMDELSTRGIFQADARRMQFLEGHAKEAALFGNQRGRMADLQEIQSIRTRLTNAGVYKDPNQGIIDEIKTLGEKGMPVEIKNAD